MVSVRAIYRNGQLQLLDPVELTEGQEVQLQIVDTMTDRVQLALSDLLAHNSETTRQSSTLNEQVIQQNIDESAKGVTLSDVIIEERQSGR